MILEQVDGRNVTIQGYTTAQIFDSQQLLQQLRSRFPKVEIQAFRADRIAGKEHIRFAAEEAVRAFEQHRERSRSLAVELILYASCQRQISKAIQILGLSRNTHDLVLVGISRGESAQSLLKKAEVALKAQPDDNVIEMLTSEKIANMMRVYDVSKDSMVAARLPEENDKSVLKRLIVERCALLAIEKK